MSQDATGTDHRYNWADITDDEDPPVLVRADRVVGTEWFDGSSSGSNLTEDKKLCCEDCGRKLVCHDCNVVTDSSNR